MWQINCLKIYQSCVEIMKNGLVIAGQKKKEEEGNLGAALKLNS